MHEVTSADTMLALHDHERNHYGVMLILHFEWFQSMKEVVIAKSCGATINATRGGSLNVGSASSR